MKRSPKTGLLLAPLAVPLAFVAWVLVLGDDPAIKDSLWGASPMAWAAVLGAVTLFSYVASALLGVPMIRVLKRLDRLTYWRVVPAAGILGALALVAHMFGTGGYVVGSLWLPLAELAGAGALLGILVGASYCWLSGIGSQ
jgi:hypothetical protein